MTEKKKAFCKLCSKNKTSTQASASCSRLHSSSLAFRTRLAFPSLLYNPADKYNGIPYTREMAHQDFFLAIPLSYYFQFVIMKLTTCLLPKKKRKIVNAIHTSLPVCFIKLSKVPLLLQHLKPQVRFSLVQGFCQLSSRHRTGFLTSKLTSYLLTRYCDNVSNFL